VRSKSSRIWIFDLDNTLHDASPHINHAMTRYVMEHAAVDEAGANELRVRYWQRYGATLLGLVRHHGVEPRHFLWHTHQFPDLHAMLVFERGLRGMLRCLPGKKIVFSNAPMHYSRAVLKSLNILDLFDDVYCIEQARLRPKPSSFGFRRILHEHGAAPRRCIMVEDSLENLRTAKRLGMGTVWVTRGRQWPAFVDLRITSVLQLRHMLNKL
jgi:putative hydrolase of the HAD superfamily